MSTDRIRQLLSRIDAEARTLPAGSRNRILNLTRLMRLETVKQERKQQKQKAL